MTTTSKVKTVKDHTALPSTTVVVIFILFTSVLHGGGLNFLMGDTGLDGGGDNPFMVTGPHAHKNTD